MFVSKDFLELTVGGFVCLVVFFSVGTHWNKPSAMEYDK